MLQFITSNQNFYYINVIQHVASRAFECFMLVLGPCLVSVVFVLISVELVAYFKYLLPLHASWEETPLLWCAHVAWTLNLLVNALFNYVSCVTTNPGTHDSPAYRRLMEEARAMGVLSSQDVEAEPRRRQPRRGEHAAQQQTRQEGQQTRPHPRVECQTVEKQEG